MPELSCDVLVLHPDATLDAIVELYHRMVFVCAQDADNGGQRDGDGVIVFANGAVLDKYAPLLLERGVPFFPDWRDSEEYRTLLRLGLSRGQVYLMYRKNSLWSYRLARSGEVEVRDPGGRIDLIPTPTK